MGEESGAKAIALDEGANGVFRNLSNFLRILLIIFDIY